MRSYWRTAKPWILCLSIVAAVAMAGILAPVISDQPDCLAAQRWVESHASELPDSLGEFSSFPHLYRAQIFGRLPAQAKGRLWREHLGDALAGHPEWNPQQVALVSRAIETFTPEIFALTEDDPARREAGQRIDAIWEEAGQLFSRQEAEALLVRLGSPQPTYRAVSSWPIYLRSVGWPSWSAAAQVGIDPDRQACSCKSWVEQPCPNLEWCLGGCKATWCGPGLFDICDGICVATAPADPVPADPLDQPRGE